MGQPPSVLVVEDDADTRDLEVRILVDSGIPAQGVPDVARALAALQAVGYDVVLCDVMMPGQSGLDLIRAIRDRGLDVAAIVVTAYATVKLCVEAMRLGVSDLLEKPTRAEQLLEAVRRAHQRLVQERQLRARASELRKERDDIVRAHDARLALHARAAAAVGAEGFADLVDILRADGGSLTPELAAVSPHRLADACVREAIRIRPDAAGSIAVRGQESVPGPLMLDEPRVATLVGRLLASSTRAVADGAVRLELATHDRDLVLLIRDRGDRPPRELLAGPPFAKPDRLPSWARAAGADLARILAAGAVARALGAFVTLGAEEPTGTRWEVRFPSVLPG